MSKSVFPVHVMSRKSKESPWKLLRGLLASLEDRIKGFTFSSERLWMK